ncbi:hypothetical protein SERLADRAFT_378118 [Serpula lacrymans var. lacrymans S7.9]|uniref:Uncharacterized protein n=1 Tax=Serpula lacrymans var. lacrymans (strain S7.9) TaxID=578457 RepID=F8NGI9_SERL9|nr:uncharacterized protein SERLADRAFT_378118 [Serpula lacrymans var. lacrymans S7.9]EGO29376.1 hypothetical protein SERLADRAFT_378118 [Serpula lacrymans var. lacrymans S7.9]
MDTPIQQLSPVSRSLLVWLNSQGRLHWVFHKVFQNIQSNRVSFSRTPRSELMLMVSSEGSKPLMA